MGWSTAPYVPTPHEIVRRMLKVARVGLGDVVYDLGCGDGRILIIAVKEFGADRAAGYEIREDLCSIALSQIERQGLQGRVKLVNGDFFDADLSKATVITIYLDDSTNQRLKPKIEREARVGTRIVSYAYAVTGWKATKKIRLRDDTVFLYTVPESIYLECGRKQKEQQSRRAESRRRVNERESNQSGSLHDRKPECEECVFKGYTEFCWVYCPLHHDYEKTKSPKRVEERRGTRKLRG